VFFVQQWGTFNRETGEVALHAEPGDNQRLPDGRDLLDAAAVQTFLNGGTVYAVKAVEIPNGGILAAVFRY